MQTKINRRYMPERKHEYGLFLKQDVKPLCGFVSVENREVYPLEPEELETPVRRFVKLVNK